MTLLNRLPSENNNGNIEYKWKLCNIKEDKINHLTSQMLYRLTEGNGYAKYYIGVQDNGNTDGIKRDELTITFYNLLECCKLINATVTEYKIYTQYNNKYCMYIKYNIDELPSDKIVI
jgi:GTPase